MRTIEIIIGQKRKQYSGPASWEQVPDEMSLKLFTLTKAALTKKHLAFAIPMLVYGIPKHVMDLFTNARVKSRDLENDADDLVYLGEQLLNSCDWVYTDPPPAKWLRRTVNLGKQFHDVCADKLYDMTFGEFIFTESYAGTDTAKLAAVLYRKRSFFKPRGKRGPFIHDDIERFAKIWRQDKFNTVRDLISWNYVGMVEHLKRVFPDVFGKAPDPVAGIPAEPVKQSQWLDTALSFAENDTAKFRALEKEELYIVLRMISNRIKQNKELESQYKK